MARTVRRHDSSCAKRTRSRTVKSRSPCCPGKTDRDDPDLDGIAQRSGSYRPCGEAARRRCRAHRRQPPLSFLSHAAGSRAEGPHEASAEGLPPGDLQLTREDSVGATGRSSLHSRNHNCASRQLFKTDFLKKAGFLQRVDKRIVEEFLRVGVFCVGKLLFIEIVKLSSDGFRSYRKIHRPVRRKRFEGAIHRRRIIDLDVLADRLLRHRRFLSRKTTPSAIAFKK